MSSISSTTTSQLYAQRWSTQDNPQTRMSNTISSELSAGSLSSTDATALTSALSSIGSSLSADSSSVSGSSSQAKLDPSSMKDRIDSLIADQVSSGSLTGDQATELKNLFASHGQSTQTADVASGEGGPSGAGGPPPGPPPSDAAGSAASSTSSSASTSSPGDLLASFLQQVQSSQSSNAGYGASGTNTSLNTAALLFDFQS